jgi:hypothetical protein
MTLVLDGREETRRRRRRRRTSANDAKNIFFFLLFSLILLFFSCFDCDGDAKRSGDVVGVFFVGASRAGGRPSAAAARRPATTTTTTTTRHRQQRKQQQQREIEEKKRRIQKKEDERRAATEEEEKKSAALLPPPPPKEEEEEEKEGGRASEGADEEEGKVKEDDIEQMHSSFQPPNEQGGEEEKKESIPEETTEEEEEAPTTTDAKVPSEEFEALPRSSSPEKAEEDTTTETSPVEEDVKKRGEGEEEKEQEREVVEVQESDALSIGDLGTDSPSETDFDAVSKNEERRGGTVSESEAAPMTMSPEEEQAIDDAIVPPEEEVVKTEEGEEEQVDGEISVGAEEEQPSVEPDAAPELGEAKEEKILKDEEKSDEKANEQLSKYEALIKEEEEEEELEKMEKTKEDGVQAQEQTEEGSVVAEEKTPEEIEELPQPLDEEKKEEEDAPSQKTEKEVIFGGKSDTHDPLFIKDNEEEKAQVEENAPMQEADALSMDFTSDDAAPATDGAEEKEKKASEEVVVASEETPVVAPSDELESRKEEEEEKKVEQEDAPIKKEEEEPEQEKDWDKSHGVYEALLESEKSEEAVADAIVSADKSSDGDANITTSSTTKATKVFGGIPKSLGVVSASPLTNPSLSFAAFRFSKRLGYAFARPGKCICAGSCECAGACGSSMDSLEKQSTALKDAGVDAGISVISDASLVYNEDLNLERWIGEIADPAKYGLERLYAAVEYYISTDVENEDATFYSIMNKSPYPELAKCDVFDAMFSQLREDRKNGKTVKVNVDAKDEAKLAVLTACDGFVNNPQATKFGGGTSAKEIAQRFDAIIPADSGLDGLISLTFMSGFAISDLAYGANEEDSKINKMRKEMGISVDLANEAEAVLKRLRESNKVDEELYKQSTAWLDGVKEAHRKAFNAHKAIVEVWMEESDQYCESSSTGSKTCTRDDSSSTTTTTTDQFAELLGSFPESCKASDPKTRSCVDDWWDCEGPGSEGSAFAGQFSKTSATTTTTMTTPSDATGDSGGRTSGGKSRVSAVEALSNFKYKVMYDREHPLNKAAQFGAHHSKKFARGTMNAVNVGAGHAVANFKKIPTGVHAGVAIMFIFSLFGYYTYSQYKSLQPVSSLELNTSSVKVLKAFENKEKALRGISNVPAGELMRDDAFWGGGLSQSEMERGTAGRGSSRLTGGKRRNRNTKSRGPMTEEELNFYDDVSD